MRPMVRACRGRSGATVSHSLTCGNVEHEARRVSQLEHPVTIGRGGTHHPGNDAFEVTGTLYFEHDVELWRKLTLSNRRCALVSMRSGRVEAHLQPTIAR